MQGIDSIDGWVLHFGAAKGKFNKQAFAITVSTMSKNNMMYCIASVFTKNEYMQHVQDFIAGVMPDEKKFVLKPNQQPEQNNDMLRSLSQAAVSLHNNESESSKPAKKRPITDTNMKTKKKAGKVKRIEAKKAKEDVVDAE